MRTLSDVKAGEFVFLDEAAFGARGKTTRLVQIQHVAKKTRLHGGRLYISMVGLWSDWRYGFDPTTGEANQYPSATMRIASALEVSEWQAEEAAAAAKKAAEVEAAVALSLKKDAAPALYNALVKAKLELQELHDSHVYDGEADHPRECSLCALAKEIQDALDLADGKIGALRCDQ